MERTRSETLKLFVVSDVERRSTPREAAASQYRVGLLRFELGRVLVFHGGVFECSSRMTGNLHVRFLEGWASAMAPGYSTILGPVPTCPVSALIGHYGAR